MKLDPGESVRCVFTNTKRGKLEIEKQTTPADPKAEADQDKFGFAAELPGDGDDAFELDDDDVRTVSNIVPGSYSVSEDDPTPGYDLTDLTCDDGQSTTPSTTNLGTRTATIKVDPGETVRCVFTNTKRGVLEIEKQTTPADPKPEADQDKFGFAADLPGAGDDAFELDDDDVRTVSNIVPGSYTVSEDDPTPGYDLTDLTCDDGQSATPSDTSLATRTATIKVDPGETVRCVFTNTRRATISIEKQTSPADPKPEADQDKFGFAADLPGTDDDAFELDDDDVKSVTDVAPGSYSVSENDPTPGYDLTDLTCTDGQSATPSTTNVDTRTAVVKLDPGESVRCVFTNTKRGILEIEKQTSPDDPSAEADQDKFGFAAELPGVSDDAFALDDDDVKTVSNIVPGSYTVSEDDPTPGYDLTALTCNDGQSTTPSTTNVATRTATIKVDPARRSVACSRTPSAACSRSRSRRHRPIPRRKPIRTSSASRPSCRAPATMRSSSTRRRQDGLKHRPGSYAVSENDPTPGYDLTELSCNEVSRRHRRRRTRFPHGDDQGRSG